MQRVALITGAAKRLGAAISKDLHSAGFNIILHYGSSETEARSLETQLNQRRSGSAWAVSANLSNEAHLEELAKAAVSKWGRLDVLVNNASAFQPDILASEESNDKNVVPAFKANFSINALAPYLLSTQLATELKRTQGQIINLVDIYGERPLKAHSSYCMSKSANAMMVQSLALELAPEVRVNGIAPGAILWPEQNSECTAEYQQNLLRKIPLGRLGTLDDITRCVNFIVECNYLNGQIIRVDGGRSVTI